MTLSINEAYGVTSTEGKDKDDYNGLSSNNKEPVAVAPNQAYGVSSAKKVEYYNNQAGSGEVAVAANQAYGVTSTDEGGKYDYDYIVSDIPKDHVTPLPSKAAYEAAGADKDDYYNIPSPTSPSNTDLLPNDEAIYLNQAHKIVPPKPGHKLQTFV